MNDQRILPAQLALELDMFIDGDIRDIAKYDNREPYDESGTFALHRMAARIYAAGWDDGERSADQRLRASLRRAAERKGGS